MANNNNNDVCKTGCGSKGLGLRGYVQSAWGTWGVWSWLLDKLFELLAGFKPVKCALSALSNFINKGKTALQTFFDFFLKIINQI